MQTVPSLQPSSASGLKRPPAITVQGEVLSDYKAIGICVTTRLSVIRCYHQ